MLVHGLSSHKGQNVITAIRLRLAQHLTVARLRVLQRVRRVKCSFVRIYLVNCSEAERAEVHTIDPRHVEKVGRLLQSKLGIKGRIPHVVVVCFGRRARLDLAPGAIADSLRSGRGWGAWVRQEGAAAALFNDIVPIRKIMIHEVTHALLHILANGFPYPRALEEGIAKMMEFYAFGERPRDDDKGNDHASAEHRNLMPAECVTVHSLLTIDPRRKKDGTDWDGNSLIVLTNRSFWLSCYLGELAKSRVALRSMLYTLRVNNIRGGEAVYEWLQQSTGLDASALERGFNSFCVTGSTDV